MNGAPPFAELVAATNYSFLRGASHPAEMVARAHALGMTGLGIADRNTVAGVVRAHVAWREVGGLAGGFRLAVGARLAFADGTPDVIAYPATRHGWGRLTRLLTLGNRRTEKGDCRLTLPDLLDHAEDLLLIATGREQALLDRLAEVRPGAVWLATAMLRAGADARRLAGAQALSAATGVPLLATNDALYARPEARPLHDILTSIREGTTIAGAGRRLLANAERHLKAPAEMSRLFRSCPEAICATTDFLSRIDFTLDDLKYEYPHESVPAGWEPQGWLEHLVQEGGRARFPQGLPETYRAVLNEEFKLIRKCNYAYYFLTVHDIVRHARSLDPPILCQGRGSAANSLVCYFLDITPIDPVREKLLFSRFLSEARDEPPDIDVDFEHERREEIMQYIYARHGRERAGIAATVIHYRPRSALREVGKALGLSEDVTARLASTIWGHWGDDVPEARVAEAGLDMANPAIARLKALVDQLLTFPRHLSQHVGGFVLTEGRLDELVPIHNAAMPDRTFIEWDKADIEALRLMKVDVLALGMLTCIRKSFDLLRRHGLGDHDLQNVPLEDEEQEKVYRMLQRGDSIGTFQVESRAQIAMLPRLKPRELYDLVIQVAIVRPGPIQGGMVHPYLRRRNGEEDVAFPSPAPPHDRNELHEVLGKTLGVPLFQEQAMKLAITAAGFSPTEADGLRRAMATFRNRGTVAPYRDRMVGGMTARGYERDFAERCFEQIKGFGEYGFPESHAQAFAWLAYVSSWLKCRHPAVFTCALLNSQPMGFYAPAQLVRDAQEHGVEVRAVDVNASHGDCTLEGPDGSPLALRLGFARIDGFRENWAREIVEARRGGAFASAEDLVRRAGLPSLALRKLADADAFGSLAQSRRDALWEVRRTPPTQLPLFASADAPELGREVGPRLPAMPLSEEVVADYQTARLSLKGHPMQFLRESLAREGVLACADANAAPDGRKVRVAGVVLTRQRPGKGNAVFITIEDETGIVNALLWSRDLERQRRAVMIARLMLIEGEIQKSKEGVVHLMATRVIDRTAMLGGLADQPQVIPQTSRGDEIRHPQRPRTHGHPRNVRILPRSRDFH
ncbi:error-prone DNA polymerase [Novosphingobium flavum]|uniref:Error-prone DNA polymerase n=1 Tax=Novosphingobium flavum TaxID=1778672 RepID=A0A7X1KLC3_9SPHN|nr:error-prone DNA polymerase [Novosphingobium flavum]MBC2665456.1 error-prone DNA polymerase [Novosphingobium flavum]